MSRDIINRPAHYTHSDVEPIKAIEAWRLGFHLGNVVKYVARADHKGSRLDDLRKAAWYLEREIERERIEIGLREPMKNAPESDLTAIPPRHWLAESEGA